MSRKDYNALADAISAERARGRYARLRPRQAVGHLLMLACDDPCSPAEECYCRRVNAARGGTPTAYVEQEPVCCIDCGEPLCGDEPTRCDYCVQHALDLATIPDSPVPYGR